MTCNVVSPARFVPFVPLVGLSLPVQIETGEKENRMAFGEDLLFTHGGLSGPAVLQISSDWTECAPIRLNLAPEVEVTGWPGGYNFQ